MKEITIDGVTYTLQEKVSNKWRLPTIEELLALVDYTKYDPASTVDITSDYYWSSTTDASRSDYAWLVDFCNGSPDGYYKTASEYVRCVRDTEDGLEWSEDAPKQMTWDEAMKYAESLNN
jgi:hypothetical protein